MTKHEQLLRYANLKRSRGGILTPDRYFREVQMCFDGGLCPIKSFGLKSQQEWESAIEKAEDQLAYTNDEMVIKAHEKAKGGPVMQFDCIITSTKRDRDRDILETKGASIDAKCPLLWQHISMQPIGAMANVLAHTDEKLAGRFTIADTELGRDAATLIECGALRISHGFEPTKFKPLKDESEGWHIEEFEIFEVSVVSVPSNTDAVITQFSREKLHDPLVKEWAGKLFEQRPTQVSVSVDVSKMDMKAAPCSCQKDAELTTSIVEGGESQAWERKGGTLVPVAQNGTPEITEIDATKGDEPHDEKMDCECPECGYKGQMSDFRMGGDEEKAAQDQYAIVKVFPIEHGWRLGYDGENEIALRFIDEWGTKSSAINYRNAVAYLSRAPIEQAKELGRLANSITAAHESKQRAEQIERENSAVMELLS